MKILSYCTENSSLRHLLKLTIKNFTLKLMNNEYEGYYRGDKKPKDLLISEIEFWGR